MNMEVDLIHNKNQVYLLFLGLPTPYLPTQYFQICFAPVSSTKAKEFITNTSSLTYVKILTPKKVLLRRILVASHCLQRSAHAGLRNCSC